MAFETETDFSSVVAQGFGGRRKDGTPYRTEIEGYLVGRTTKPDAKKKSGISHIYYLQTDNGVEGIYGKTNLDTQMANLYDKCLGYLVRITQSGSRPTPNGDMWLFKVERDKSQKLEDSAIEELRASTAATSTDSFSDESESDTDTETLDQPPQAPVRKPSVAAKAPDAAAVARARAQLGLK